MFHRLDFRVHCHATEVEERVQQAFALVTGVGNPDVSKTQGYYGNPIVVFTARIKGAEAIDTFWRRVKEAGELDAILRTLERRIDDDCQIHLRFDKQEAFLGRLRVADHDDVISMKGKVAAYPAKRERALEAAASYLEGV